LLKIRLPASTDLLRGSSRAFIATLLLIALSGCSSGDKANDETANALTNSTEEFAGESYSEFDERRDSNEGSQGSVKGYDCTKDCGGHNAGYAWAEEKGITDPDQCGGKSWSFIEGCRAYAEQASDEGE
jgi:hypothetical protein